jgi:hypothetical protein
MEPLFNIVWRFYHGKFSGLFCFSIFSFIILANWAFFTKFIEPGFRQIQKKIGRLSFWSLILMPFILFFWAAYPGVYVIDSMLQLKQAVGGSFGDWHPPIMSWIWGILINLTNSVECFFWLHTLVVFFSIFLWSYIFLKLTQTPTWVVFLIAFLSPVYLLYSGVVIKDTGTAFGLLAACGLAILPMLGGANKFISYSLAILLLFYSSSVRHNALPAVLPVLFIIFYDLIAGRFRILKVATMVVIVSISFYIVGNILKYDFLKSRREFIQQTLFFHDLAFISLGNGKTPAFPVEFQTHNFSTSALRDSRMQGSSGRLFLFFDNPQHPLQLSESSEANSILKKSWVETVGQNPLMYLKHRLLVFSFFLQLQGGYWGKNSIYPIEMARDHNLILPKSLPGSRYVEHILSRSVGFLANWTPFISVWFWFVASLFLPIFSLLRLQHGPLYKFSFAIALSGLFYLLPYFFILAHCEHRFVYWSSIAAIFSFCLLFSKPHFEPTGK